MKIKITLFIALFVLSISNTFAHALWIETTATGKKGQKQEVKIFFGEYEANEPDSAKKWFSNLKEFSISVTAPNGTVKILKATPDVHYYKTSFVPNQDGVYILSVVHEVAAVYEHAKIEYYAFANVAVGKSKINTAYPANAIFTIQPSKAALKTGEDFTYQVVFNKTPFAKKKVAVVDPARKKQEPETDANGNFIFKPAQKGAYFIEAFNEDQTPGTLNGKAYEKVWHLVTYFTTAE